MKAPKGQIWVCTVCGRASKERRPGERNSGSYGEHCTMQYSVLCYAKKGKSRYWVKVPEKEKKEIIGLQENTEIKELKEKVKKLEDKIDRMSFENLCGRLLGDI